MKALVNAVFVATLFHQMCYASHDDYFGDSIYKPPAIYLYIAHEGSNKRAVFVATLLCQIHYATHADYFDNSLYKPPSTYIDHFNAVLLQHCCLKSATLLQKSHHFCDIVALSQLCYACYLNTIYLTSVCKKTLWSSGYRIGLIICRSPVRVSPGSQIFICIKSCNNILLYTCVAI